MLKVPDYLLDSFFSGGDSPSGPWPSYSFTRDVFSRPHTTTHHTR